MPIVKSPPLTIKLYGVRMIEFYAAIKIFTEFQKHKYVYIIMLSVEEGYKFIYTTCSQLCNNMHSRKEQIALKS